MDKITDKEFIDNINKGFELLKTNTGIQPDTIIAPKAILDRLADIQKKAGLVKEWKGNRAYRRKNKIK